MNKTRRISKTIWGVILVCAAIGVFFLFGCNSLPTVFSLFATITPTATTTSTPTSTSTSTPTATLTLTPAMTYTPRPTPTATPDQRVLNPANQHLYLYIKQRKTWHEARDYCASFGGHLVTIQVPSENKFVYDLAIDNTQTGTWLGATDEENEGTWIWVTGEPWTYSNWEKSFPEPEPNNKHSGEIILNADFMAFHFWDKTWTDWSDEQNWYFVCEWESAQ